MEVKVKSLSRVWFCNLMDCSLPGSTIHGIFQARILKWIAISVSRRSSQPSDWTWVSHIVGRRFTIWPTREVHSTDSTIGYNNWCQIRDYCRNFKQPSVQFSHSIVSNSLWPRGPQHVRPPCPTPTPRVYPNSCPLSRWCHPTISSCCPFLFLPPIPPTIMIFSNNSALHIRWCKYWSLSFNISLSNEHPGLISFRMDWLDLLAVQGTLKSLLQHHSSKASIPWCSTFFRVQLSRPYMTTGKTIALTRLCWKGNISAF